MGGRRFRKRATKLLKKESRRLFQQNKPRLEGSTLWFFTPEFMDCHQQYISNRIKCPLFTEFWWQAINILCVYHCISCFVSFSFFCVVGVLFFSHHKIVNKKPLRTIWKAPKAEAPVAAEAWCLFWNERTQMSLPFYQTFFILFVFFWVSKMEVEKWHFSRPEAALLTTFCRLSHQTNRWLVGWVK